MELWLTCALVTVVLYGLGEGLSKEPTVRLGPGRMLALYSLYSVPIYAGWFLLGGGTGSLTAVGVGLGPGPAGPVENEGPRDGILADADDDAADLRR